MGRPFPTSACIGILLLTTFDAAAQDGIDFKAERKKYEGYLARPSLQKRTDGRVYFAQTKDPRARDILVKSYGKPEEPRDHNKYLIASIVMDSFAFSDENGDVFARWRQKHRKPIDAWMWFETLRVEGMRRELEQLQSIVTGRDNAYVRAAAFAALEQHLDSYSIDRDLVGWLTELMLELPSKPIERALILEGVGAIANKKRSNLREEPWKELIRTLIRCTFEDEKTPRRSKVVVGRYLAEAFDCQHLGFEGRFWYSELDRSPGRSSHVDAGATTSVGFAGIRTMGEHVAYVIDASDSMCKPVAGKKPIDHGPTTGDKKPDLERGAVPTADDLDWNRIHTRFDAAREFLRISLATLKPTQKFSVVLFGDEAIALTATPTLVDASPKNIRKALSELYAIQMGPPRGNDRPDGTLRGLTNMHGGLRLAYRMTRKGITKKAEYADNKSMIEGCDTIFLLSDGAPTADDFHAIDKPEEDDRAGDPESHNPHEKTDNMHFYGPYANGRHTFLFEDIERLNLLRRCEIHCVAIGEAQDHLMQRIAQIGHGESIRIDSRLKRGK